MERWFLSFGNTTPATTCKNRCNLCPLACELQECEPWDWQEGRHRSPPIQQPKNSMIKQFNIWVSLTTLCFVCLGDVSAGPLQKKHVAGDSKWLLHMDLDNFRDTRVGRMAIAGMLDEALAEVKKETKLDLGPVIERIRSVTIYGSDLEQEADFKGALLLQADAEAIQIFEGLLAAQSLGESKVTVKKLPDGPNPLYSVGEELFVEVEPGHMLVLAKSLKQIDRALAVLTGKVESLAKSADSPNCFRRSPRSFSWRWWRDWGKRMPDRPRPRCCRWPMGVG